MPYGEKLRQIKKEKNLTNDEIHKICKVSLPTVTRVFDEESQGGNFETYVSLARGLGFSLDEIAGLKQPNEQPLASPIIETFNSYSEILKEKDERIKELKATNEKMEKTIELIEKEKSEIRTEKRKITSALLCLVLILVVGLIVHLFGHLGNF